MNPASRWFGPLLVGLLALVTRVATSARYWGWEEEDFTNINLTWDIARRGIGDFPQEYPPVYYGVSAVLTGVLGDAELATRSLTLVSGVALCVLVFLLGRRLFSERAGWAAGLLCVVQPQLLLYSSTPLREPFYAALSLLGLLLLMERRHLGAALAFALTALTRYEAWFSNVPFGLAAGWRTDAPRARAVFAPLALYVAFGLAWVVYVGWTTGVWNPLGSTFAMNVTDAPTADRTGVLDWAASGARVELAFLFTVVPAMLGPVLPVAAVVTAGRGVMRTENGELRLASLYCLAQLGLMAGIVFIGQFDPPNHPLYLKWSVLACALTCLFGCGGLDALLGRIAGRRWWSRAAIVGVLLLTLIPFAVEFGAETRRSDRTVRPQVEIANWIEMAYPRGTTFLLDQITLFQLDRRDHGFDMLQWQFLPAWGDDGRGWAAGPEQLGRFLAEREVALVLWCREEWTQGPVIAPYLAEPKNHRLGPVELRLIHADDAYGFRLYTVVRAPPETRPR